MKDKDSVNYLRYANVGANPKASDIPNNIKRIRFMRIDRSLKRKAYQIRISPGISLIHYYTRYFDRLILPKLLFRLCPVQTYIRARSRKGIP